VNEERGLGWFKRKKYVDFFRYEGFGLKPREVFYIEINLWENWDRWLS